MNVENASSVHGHGKVHVQSVSRVSAGRLIFFMCLCVVALSLGMAAHHFLSSGEVRLGEKQFDSIADRALDTALEISRRKRLGTLSMATVASFANSNVDKWPMVTVPGFEAIANNIMRTSAGHGMGLVPFVDPEDVEMFEDFAYDYFYSARNPPFPNTTAMSSFGRGVWSTDSSTGERYHDTDGTTPYGSPYKILAPLIQHSNGPDEVLMTNMHSEDMRGRAIDSIIDCVRQWVVENGQPSHDCGLITNVDYLYTDHSSEPQPSAIIMHPIFPADNSTKLVGVIVSSIVWRNVLFKVFADGVNGVDCVVATEDKAYTYRIVDGNPVLRGEGDLHIPKFGKYERRITLTPDGLYNAASATYTLSVYPSSGFFLSYTTLNPIVATIGAICIILLTSVLFALYDYCVRQEFLAKADLLESKRKFVRYVSHEVRTPLNSVCMGLTLMQEEIENAIHQQNQRRYRTEINEFSDPFESVLDNADTECKRASTNQLTCVTNVQRGFVSSVHPYGIEKDFAVEWLQLAQDIYDNSQSAVGVLNDLLSYDRIEVGRLNLELCVIPIFNLIETTATEFKLPAAKKRINLIVNFSPMGSDSIIQTIEMGRSGSSKNLQLSAEILNRKVVGDTIRISQVFRNLLSNAVKFTSEGGNIIVNASWNDEGHTHPGNRPCNGLHRFILKNGDELSCDKCGYLKITVADSGAGMTKSQLKGLFGHGVQFNVNELQSGQGSGLGLYIAKGIMDQHGGTLTASSDGLGKGTIFTMKLPLFQVPDGEVSDTFPLVSEDMTRQSLSTLHPLPTLPAPLSSLPPLFPPTSQIEPSNFHILVVDDAASNRKLLKRLLERQGHRCDEAENGQYALDLVKATMARHEPYDAILLDFEMPVMNGPMAAKEMRRLGCDSFIVGITGNVLPEDVIYFKQSGANGVLPKPFKLENLDQLWMEYAMTDNPSLVGTSLRRSLPLQ